MKNTIKPQRGFIAHRGCLNLSIRFGIDKTMLEATSSVFKLFPRAFIMPQKLFLWGGGVTAIRRFCFGKKIPGGVRRWVFWRG